MVRTASTGKYRQFHFIFFLVFVIAIFAVVLYSCKHEKKEKLYSRLTNSGIEFNNPVVDGKV